MRKSKKVVALVVSILMVCSMASGLSVFAATASTKTLAVTSSLDNQTVSPTATVIQTIGLSSFSDGTGANQLVVGGVRAFSLDVSFVSADFTVTTVDGGAKNGDFTWSIPSTGDLRIVYADSGNGTTPLPTGYSFQIEYTAKSGATIGNVDAFSVGSSSVTSFIDSSNPASDATSAQVDGRTITPTFPANVSATIAPSGPPVDISSFTLTDSMTVTSDYDYTATNVLSNIQEYTDVPTMIAALNPQAGVSLVFTDINNNVLANDGSDGAFVGTGTTIAVIRNGSTIITYTVLIYGDINGNGYIDNDDFQTYIDWFDGYSYEIAGVGSLAADVVGEGYVSNDNFQVFIDWYDSYPIFQDPTQTYNYYYGG